LIFRYFSVPAIYQHRVLFWGIIGALISRAIFIFAGVALVQQFHWIIYVFGAFLLLTGIRMAFEKEKEIHPERNIVLRLLRRVMPLTSEYYGQKFFVREAGRLVATPLFITLIVIETTDIIFAVDSIPAILAITADPFLVYTSNVFAILGLRALFFALAAFMGLFAYLHYGLSAVLVFVGGKMLLEDVVEVPTLVSLAVVGGLLALSVIVSILLAPKVKRPPTDTTPEER
ncbi:MAG TPA: TerC/Alx family metal homeostasis membrane protein, partial [Planctomycetota bacterium]|nr:TerC/Alx family metal homeostasis membrane protein [Planctomycetota bacterium]